MNKREIGNKFEQLACNILKQLNYQILHRNFIIKPWEIDIIAKHNNTIHLIEVRKLSPMGYVSKKKINNIIQGGNHWNNFYNFDNLPLSIDLFLIENKYKYNFLQNITY